jgi:hypothetical protein
MKRTMTMGLACLMTAALVACSSGSGSDAAKSGSASVSGSKGSEAGPQTASHVSATPTAGGGSAGSEGNAAGGPSGVPTPVTGGSKVVAIAFGSPSAEVTRRFATPVRTLKGVYSSAAVRSASQAGQEIGGLAVFTFPSDQASNPIFRGQVLNQLVMTTAGARSVRTDRVGSQKVVISGGTGGVVGWLSGTKAYVVLSGSSAATAMTIAAAQLARS